MKNTTFLDNLTQGWIFVFGAAAMLLISKPGPLYAWGFLLGLIAQPAWFYTTIKKKQWGVTALSCLYTIAWVRGIYYNLLPILGHHGRPF